MLLLEMGAMLLRDGTAHESWRGQGCYHKASRKAGVHQPVSSLIDVRPSKEASLSLALFYSRLSLSFSVNTGPTSRGSLQVCQDVTSLSTPAWVSGRLLGQPLALVSRYQ